MLTPGRILLTLRMRIVPSHLFKKSIVSMNCITLEIFTPWIIIPYTIRNTELKRSHVKIKEIITSVQLRI